MADGHGGRIVGTGGYTMLMASPCDNCLRYKSCRINAVCCKDYVKYMNKGIIIKLNRDPVIKISDI